MNERIAAILSDLQRVRDNLKALSDDIWLSIDHNDDQRLEEGLAFKKAYNADMAEFQRIAERLAARIQSFTGVRPGEPEPGSGLLAPGRGQAVVSRVRLARIGSGRRIDAKRRAEVLRHISEGDECSLDESWEYKRPRSFTLPDGVYEADSWRDVYFSVLRYLAKLDSARYQRLPEHRQFVGSKGTVWFSRDPKDFKSSESIGEGVYADRTLSADSTRNRIRTLFTVFGVPYEALRIYLRSQQPD